MKSVENNKDIIKIEEDISNYYSICQNRDLFNNEKIKNCKNLKRILDKSAENIEFLDEIRREMLADLNFFYVDHCKGPEIKANPKTYGIKINF